MEEETEVPEMRETNGLTKLKNLEVTKVFRNQTPPKEGEVWTDPLFPPTAESILSKEYKEGKLKKEQYDYIKKEIEVDKLEWKRMSDVHPDNFYVFEGAIELRDIKQGNFSNCYFLSALAALTEYPDFIYCRFRHVKPNKDCFYEIELLKKLE